MAGEGSAVPAQQRHGLLLGQARAQAEQEALHALGCVAGGVLVAGQLLDLVHRPQPIGRIDEHPDRVLDSTPRPDR